MDTNCGNAAPTRKPLPPGRHYKWPIITDETREAVLAQLDESVSNYYNSGIITEFQNAFSSYHDRKYALLFNTGTSAMLAMMVGIGIQNGDEIIAPAYTFFATATPALLFGAKVVFADCNPDGNINPNEIRKKISTKTKGVIVTHMWGIPCDMEEILKICEDHGIPLIEDCSQAPGAKYKGRIVGTFGVAAAWSLHGMKLVAGGQGGIFLTNDEQIFQRAQLFGPVDKGYVDKIEADDPLFEIAKIGFALNHRIHPLAAVMANQQFKHLDEWIKQKNEFAKQMTKVVEKVKWLEPPKYDPTLKVPVWYGYIIQFKPEKCKFSIESFIKKLHEKGMIEVERPIWGHCHDYPIFEGTGEMYPVAEHFHQNAIKLPVWVNESDSEIVDGYMARLEEVVKEIEGN